MRKTWVVAAASIGFLSLSQPAAAQTPTPGCVAGAKLEGLWGNEWYEVTVKPGPLKAGWCFVGFDGWASSYDSHVSALRPRGSGPITRPANPVADTPTSDRPTVSAGAAGVVRDGRYSCGKIVGGGGGFRNFGTFTIRGGQLADSPLPTGWSVVSITNGPRNPRGVSIVKVLYRTASGNTDMLDCDPA